jgi:hypothetical protein
VESLTGSLQRAFVLRVSPRDRDRILVPVQFDGLQTALPVRAHDLAGRNRARSSFDDGDRYDDSFALADVRLSGEAPHDEVALPVVLAQSSGDLYSDTAIITLH